MCLQLSTILKLSVRNSTTASDMCIKQGPLTATLGGGHKYR